MFESCLEKQAAVKKIFESCPTKEAKYQKIIEMGRLQAPLPAENKKPENIVKGCQSTLYLSSFYTDKKVYFQAEADALISAGLAAILIAVYSGETPETILKCPPTYLEELGISASLTPNRAHGLYNIHLRMKQDALKYLLEQNRS